MRRPCREMLTASGLCLVCLAAHADDPPAGAPDPAEGLWINPGFYSYHFQHDRNLNSKTVGIGLEYRYSATNSVMVGAYHNSNYHISHYAGLFWRPVELGPMRLGLVIGGVNGYPSTRKGGWFPVVIPAVSAEYKRIGLNVLYIPSFGNSVNGSLTFQLRFKLF